MCQIFNVVQPPRYSFRHYFYILLVATQRFSFRLLKLSSKYLHQRSIGIFAISIYAFLFGDFMLGVEANHSDLSLVLLVALGTPNDFDSIFYFVRSP